MKNDIHIALKYQFLILMDLPKTGIAKSHLHIPADLHYVI